MAAVGCSFSATNAAHVCCSWCWSGICRATSVAASGIGAMVGFGLVRGTESLKMAAVLVEVCRVEEALSSARVIGRAGREGAWITGFFFSKW